MDHEMQACTVIMPSMASMHTHAHGNSEKQHKAVEGKKYIQLIIVYK